MRIIGKLSMIFLNCISEESKQLKYQQAPVQKNQPAIDNF